MGEIINVSDYMKNKGIDILNSIHANGFKTEYEKQCEESGRDNPDYNDPCVVIDYAYFVARVTNTDTAKLLNEIATNKDIHFDIDENFKELVSLLNDNINLYSALPKDINDGYNEMDTEFGDRKLYNIISATLQEKNIHSKTYNPLLLELHRKVLHQRGMVIINTEKIIELDGIVLNKLYQDGININTANDLLLDIKAFNDAIDMIKSYELI